MKDKLLISVITAAYNGARYLPHLIESVLSQDYDCFEHIIVEDGSTDGGDTVKVLEGYPHLRWWSRENKGQFSAQDEGMRAARGDVVTFINQDDTYFSPGVFSMVVESLQQHPRWDFVFGKTRYMDEAGLPLPIRRGLEHRFSRWLIRSVSCIPHLSLFVRRDLVVSNGIYFDPTFHMTGDLDWLIRLADVSRDYGYIGQPLGLVRIHEGQKSEIYGNRGFLPEFKRICKKNGRSYRLMLFLRSTINTLTRIKTAFVMLFEIGPVKFVKRFWRYLRKRFSRARGK